MAKTEIAEPVAKIKHGTTISSAGQILYDCPIQIKNQADLQNYGITCERHSVKNNIRGLKELGYDIAVTEKGSFLAERIFAEVILSTR